MHTAVDIFLWLNLAACALLAGLYFAFSTFVMRALASLGPTAGAAAMNAINTHILRSAFMPVFLGSSLLSLVMAGLAAWSWAEPGAMAMFAGGLVYFVGMFVVTMVFNVPLNNALLAAAADTEAVWRRYLDRWVFWNHLRTLASLAATLLFAAALVQR
jgi:uncharacterized membrane protein